MPQPFADDAARGSAKLRRIERDPQVSVLVTNPEVRKTLDAWVTAKDAFASLSLTPSRIRSGA